MEMFKDVVDAKGRFSRCSPDLVVLFHSSIREVGQKLLAAQACYALFVKSAKSPPLEGSVQERHKSSSTNPLGNSQDRLGDPSLSVFSAVRDQPR